MTTVASPKPETLRSGTDDRAIRGDARRRQATGVGVRSAFDAMRARNRTVHFTVMGE